MHISLFAFCVSSVGCLPLYRDDVKFWFMRVVEDIGRYIMLLEPVGIATGVTGTARVVVV